MRVLVVGAGDAFTRRGFPASALLEGPEGYVLLDCPDLFHRALAEACQRSGWQVEPHAIHDILLTHLHGDHCNGLEAFLFARRIARSRDASVPLPRIFTNRKAAARLWDRLAPAMEGQTWFGRPARPADYFDLRPLDPEVPVHVAGLRVRCRSTRHPVPTTGFLIDDGAATLGWSGDTSFDPAHLEWLDEADLIVHEVGPEPIHTPLERLGALSEPQRERLRLIHAPDDFGAHLDGLAVLVEGDVLQVAARARGDSRRT